MAHEKKQANESETPPVQPVAEQVKLSEEALKALMKQA